MEKAKLRKLIKEMEGLIKKANRIIDHAPADVFLTFTLEAIRKLKRHGASVFIRVKLLEIEKARYGDYYVCKVQFQNNEVVSLGADWFNELQTEEAKEALAKRL
jgi:hypothetical protein